MASSDLRSVTDILELEHRRIDEGLEQCQRDAASGRANEPLFAEMALTLRRHIYVEEETLFPDLEAQGMVGPILVMVQEHGDVWWFLDHVEDLLRSGADPARMAEALGALRALLGEHNAKEEHVLYPCADRILLPDDPSLLVGRLQAANRPSEWVCRAHRSSAAAEADGGPQASGAAERVVRLMRERYNCAESVFMAVCQARGLAPDSPRIATAFGGGIGGCGATCGALVGAVMAVSLRLGRDGADTSMREAYQAGQGIYAGFQAAMGAVTCGELTGLDLRTREGGQQLYQSGIFERVCLQAGAVAADLAEAALAR